MRIQSRGASTYRWTAVASPETCAGRCWQREGFLQATPGVFLVLGSRLCEPEALQLLAELQPRSRRPQAPYMGKGGACCGLCPVGQHSPTEVLLASEPRGDSPCSVIKLSAPLHCTNEQSRGHAPHSCSRSSAWLRCWRWLFKRAMCRGQPRSSIPASLGLSCWAGNL